MWLFVLQRVLIEFILDFFYFPLWWYSFGTKKALVYCYNFFQFGNSNLAPFVWFKNMFVPMFGQYDFQGRIVSFLVRVANIVFRTFALLTWLVFVLLLFIFWLILPILIFYLILSTFSVK